MNLFIQGVLTPEQIETLTTEHAATAQKDVSVAVNLSTSPQAGVGQVAVFSGGTSEHQKQAVTWWENAVRQLGFTTTTE